MTITTMLTILSYLVAAGIPSFFFIRSAIKKKKAHAAEIAKHKRIEIALRDQIVEMIELQGDKKDVKTQVKKINQNIDRLTDVVLNDNYNKQLHNMPGKRARRDDKELP